MSDATARWVNVPNGQDLKRRAQDGDTVIATIRKAGPGIYVWRCLAGPEGTARSQYAAQRRARKAISSSILDNLT